MGYFIILSQILILGMVFYVVIQHEKREQQKSLTQNKELNETTSQVISSLVENNNKFSQQVSEMQKEFFKDVSATSYKSVFILEKLSTKLIEASTKLPQRVEVEKAEPIKVESEKIWNSIEKEDEPEYPLADIARIPMVNGVKLRFEDETEDYNMNITPSGNPNADMEALMRDTQGVN